LRIGIDLDNTLVCYEDLFPTLARERGLVPAEARLSRIALRQRLRAAGTEHLWTELQGEAYGPRMTDAMPFSGALDFLSQCRAAGATVFIVSHRSRSPYSGHTCDLHEAAHGWLEQHGFVGSNGSGLSRANVMLEPTMSDKLSRIAALDCTHFIDDLPEVFKDKRFPASTAPILFDPTDTSAEHGTLTRVASWPEIADVIFAARSRP
jgi:hypothetical protein